MTLRKKAQTISVDKIRRGQVLEIKYDGDTDLILVIDPKATVVTASSQGRANKLHAIKLREAGLGDADLIELIKEIRLLGKNATSEQIYNEFINSKYKTGARSYRTYTPSKIDGVMRITVGQDALSTRKIKIGNSVLYGMVHGKNIELSADDYSEFEEELLSVSGQIFFEGPDGGADLPIIEEVIRLVYNGTIKKESWEPPIEEFTRQEERGKLGMVGGVLAGWWNQWIRGDDDGGLSATNNIKAAWRKTGVSFEGKNSTIRAAFEKSVGDISLIKSKWKTYTYENKTYNWEYIDTLLDKKGFSGGTPTQALVEFNEAGHFQVFPEDSAWNMKTKKFEGDYEEGELFEAQDAFNRIRDEWLISKMKTTAGIYFGGSGHLDNVRKLPK